MLSLPDLVLAHRYLYYCKAMPVIGDFEYDKLERKARLEAPEGHPILRPGCDVADFYPDCVKNINAWDVLEQTRKVMGKK